MDPAKGAGRKPLTEEQVVKLMQLVGSEGEIKAAVSKEVGGERLERRERELLREFSGHLLFIGMKHDREPPEEAFLEMAQNVREHIAPLVGEQLEKAGVSVIGKGESEGFIDSNMGSNRDIAITSTGKVNVPTIAMKDLEKWVGKGDVKHILDGNKVAILTPTEDVLFLTKLKVVVERPDTVTPASKLEGHPVVFLPQAFHHGGTVPEPGKAFPALVLFPHKGKRFEAPKRA